MARGYQQVKTRGQIIQTLVDDNQKLEGRVHYWEDHFKDEVNKAVILGERYDELEESHSVLNTLLTELRGREVVVRWDRVLFAGWVGFMIGMLAMFFSR